MPAAGVWYDEIIYRASIRHMQQIQQGYGQAGKSTTYIIGNRPKAARPINRLLKKASFPINCLVFGAGLALATLYSPVGDRIADKINEIRTDIPATPQSISWVELEQTPFMKAGWHEGTYNLRLMLERWHAAGIPLEDFNEVIRLGRASAPMIMGTDDPNMVQRQQRLAREANRELRERWPQAYEKLSDKSWLEQNYQYVELDAETEAYFEEVIYALATEMELDEVTGDQDFLDIEDAQQARKLVEEAMEKTGLRSLRITSPVAYDPYFMGNAAYKLIQANEQLQQRTGWEGGVLGLGGRVDLVLTQPANASGSTTHLLLRNKDTSQLTITSGFSSIHHEFWHAFEIVAGRKALVPITGGTIMAQIEALQRGFAWDTPPDIEIQSIRVRNYHEVVDAIILANENIKKLSPEWIDLRQRAQDELNTPGDYWLSGQELLASAFTAQIYKYDRNSAGEPGMEDAEKHAPYFDAVFEHAAAMNLTARPQTRSRLNLADWTNGLFRPTTTLTSESLQHDAPAATVRKLTAN